MARKLKLVYLGAIYRLMFRGKANQLVETPWLQCGGRVPWLQFGAILFSMMLSVAVADVPDENRMKELNGNLYTAIATDDFVSFTNIASQIGFVAASNIVFTAFYNDLPSEDRDALHIAAKFGSIGIAKYLIANGVDVNSRKSHLGCTPLHSAASESSKIQVAKQLEMLDLLLRSGADPALPSTNENVGGSIPLHYASRVRVAEKLVAAGSPLNHRNKDKMTPLDSAIWDENNDMRDFLLSKGAEHSIMYQIQNDMSDKLASTIKDDPSWVKWADYGTDTSLLHFAVAMDATKCVRLLVSSGIDVNVPEETGMTPLHVAAALGNREMIKTLLKLKADASIKDMYECTAADLWFECGHDTYLGGMFKFPIPKGIFPWP